MNTDTDSDPAADLIAEGKTKRVVRGAESGTVLLVARHRLTGGDAARVAEMRDIGVHKTAQTARVFSLLERAGVKTAFIAQSADDALLCHECEMLPLEFVVRRFAWGSYLKREPGARRDDGPLRFDEPVRELFHKSTLLTPPAVKAAEMVSENDARARFLRDGKWADGVHTDPYILTTAAEWLLFSAKAEVRADSPLHRVSPELSAGELSSAYDEIILPAFRVLERAWSAVETRHGAVALADIKFELGRRADGSLVVADVIDNDSWRIWPGGDPSLQLDKQAFREGSPMSLVEENYAIVTELTGRFADIEI